MPKLDFSSEDLAATVGRLQAYFRYDFQMDFGRFEMERVLEVFAAELGPHFYNRGLYDAQAAFVQKLDDINDAIYQLEMPPPGK